MIGENLVKSKANLLLNTTLTNLSKDANGYVAEFDGKTRRYDAVINASYANFNAVNQMLGIPLKKLLYEHVIIPEFRFDSSPFGLTVMDGPFCSVMPKGKQPGEFLLYHVRYSVLESKLSEIRPEYRSDKTKAWKAVYSNSELFMPFLSKTVHNGYNEVTRVVHKNDDDARLTELYTYPGYKNYFALLSGKITTCVQVALEIKHILQGKNIVKRAKI